MAPGQPERPPKATSTPATPGGDTVTTAQDIEPHDAGPGDEHATTEPVDIEGDGEQRAVPDDAASTEPVDLEPPAGDRRTADGR